MTDAANNALRSLSLTADGAVTIGHAPLAIPGGNGYTVDATWYFPNHAQPPVGVVYLEHGYTRNSANMASLAQDLAEQSNSIVVTPNISSQAGDPYNIFNSSIEQAVAKMFEGNRTELTASASAAAGRSITLPQHFVLAGHSAGGNLVAAAAGYLVGDGATSNLRGVVLFDPVNNGDAVAGLAKLNGTSVPVLMIAAPPCSCNNFGAETTAIMNAAPHQFIGVELVNGSHLDSEGTSTDSVGVQFCGPAPTAANAAAVQVISSAWIKDLFTGSQSGIYGPNGAAFSIGGATGTVIGVGDKPIIQDGLPNTALHDSFADVPNGSNPTTADTGQTWGTYSEFGTNKWSVQNGAWDVNNDGTTPTAYLETNVGTTITRVGADFMFDSVNGTKTTNGEALGLISWADGGIVANGVGRRTSMHLVVGQTSATMWVRNTTNGALTPIGTYNYTAALPTDQAIHADAFIDSTNHTVTLKFGDGQAYSWTNANIVGYPGETFACYQPAYASPATDKRVKLLDVWADGTPPLV
jgi:dienelactone hydrolase